MALSKIDPLLSVGAFEALRRLRTHRETSQTLGLSELATLIRRIDADSVGLEFAASLALDNIVPKDAMHSVPHLFFRACIHQVLIRADARWARLITLGRERFVSVLDRDEQHCFRAAKLMDVPPDDEVVDWWDVLSRYMRHQGDARKHERGRLAEKLTVLHETSRLHGLGIHLPPRWVAIEDNTAGYDVLSYDQTPSGTANRLIEVKSTIASPLRFFVSRNEWETALKFGAAYHFYVWDLAAEPYRLYTRTAAQIASHIPVDQEKGKWASAEIPLSAQ